MEISRLNMGLYPLTKPQASQMAIFLLQVAEFSQQNTMEYVFQGRPTFPLLKGFKNKSCLTND